MEPVYVLASMGAITGAGLVLVGKGLLAGARKVEEFEDGADGWRKTALMISKWALAALAVAVSLTGMAVVIPSLLTWGITIATVPTLAFIIEGISLTVFFGAPSFYFGVKIVQAVSDRIFFNNNFAQV